MNQPDLYLEFLRGKIRLADFDGFEVGLDEINPILKPHQAAIVQWAVRGGNRALFEAFGLGKSVQQIEILRLIQKHAGGDVLIVAPLGVRQEFRRDGRMLGIEFDFIRSASEMREGQHFYLTNYESVRDGGSELNTGYFFDSVQYLKAAEREVGMPDLFSVLESAHGNI